MEEHVHFLVEQKGDLEQNLYDLGKGHIDIFHSLDEALIFIRNAISPDPEDDRILVWEVSLDGTKKVIWHFSGWHWDYSCADLVPGGMTQGKLLGHPDCLLNEMERELG